MIFYPKNTFFIGLYNIIYNIKFLISQFQNFQNEKPNLKVQKIWAKCKSKGKIKENYSNSKIMNKTIFMPHFPFKAFFTLHA